MQDYICIKYHIMRCLLFSILVITLAVAGCKPDAGSNATSSLSSLLATAKSDPSPTNMKAYFKEVSAFIADKSNADQVQSSLQTAADFAVEKEQPAMATSFLVPLVKSYSGPKSEANLLNLTKMLQRGNKKTAASILYKGYKETYPNGADIPELQDALPTDQPLSAYMDTTFKTVFENPDEYGLNRQSALSFVDMAEAYAMAKPSDEKSPFYLYRAGEIARSIRTIPKALTIYDWIIEKYPNYEKSATVLFLKGFILENDVKDPQAAKEIYKVFLDKYPSHELSSSVKFLIDNIGKSDAEILEFLEKTGEPKNQ